MDDVKAQVLELLEEGVAKKDIAHRLGIPLQTVAAYQAHVTRGSYTKLAGSDAATALEDLEDARILKFGLERDMQDALRRNIDQLDPSLRIVDEGKERHVETGFIDLLAQDPTGALVVIELKSGEAPDTAITQLLAYIGSLQAESDARVRGILVAREFPVRVRYAARAAGLQLMQYGYRFTFSSVS